MKAAPFTAFCSPVFLFLAGIAFVTTSLCRPLKFLVLFQNVSLPGIVPIDHRHEYSVSR